MFDEAQAASHVSQCPTSIAALAVLRHRFMQIIPNYRQ
jgi:hypothetical protein